MITIEQAEIFLLICMGLFFLWLILFLRSVAINYSKRTSIEEFKLYNDSKQEALLVGILDNVIQTVFDNYVLTEIETNSTFIKNKDTEITMTKDITELVIDKMSPVLFRNLSLVYNKKELAQFISDRVYMQVFAYWVAKK